MRRKIFEDDDELPGDGEEQYETIDGLNAAEAVNIDSFERLKSKNRRKEALRRIFYIIAAVILCAIVGAVCVVFFFGLKKTEIRGNDRYAAEEILEACGFEGNENLLTLPLDSIRTRLRERFPYIGEVTFRKVLPSALIITVSEDTPVWYTGIAGDWFLLSGDLRVISRHETPEEFALLSMPVTYVKFPQISYAMVGKPLAFSRSANYDYMTGFLNDFRKLDIFTDVDCIDCTDRYHISLFTNDGRFRITIGNSDNVDVKLRFVARVMEETFDETSMASVNVENIKALVVQQTKEPFTY